MRPLHGCHGRKAAGAVILVDFSRLLLPDKHRLFADVQQVGNVLLPDDMPPGKGHALEVGVHFGNVVAQLHAHGLLHWNFFHIYTSFLGLGRPLPQEQQMLRGQADRQLPAAQLLPQGLVQLPAQGRAGRCFHRL